MKIAVYGKIRCGKSTVCDYISDNMECEIIEFSDSLQEVVDVLYPEKKGIKDRGLLIEVGQHLREYDEDVWVNIVKYKVLNSKAPNILVCGVRQQNEYDMLKELGFTFIEVFSTEETRLERCFQSGDSFNPESLNHETENKMGAFKCDYFILNEGTTEELIEATDQIIESMAQKELKDKFFKSKINEFFERVGVNIERD
ncbi:AAA family ATPase [Clostridium perfringens]